MSSKVDASLQVKIPIIIGPTAVGKSALALKMAQETGAQIISADSMQVYRQMNIGTAKPTLEQRQGVVHHLMDIKEPDEEWNMFQFLRSIRELLAKEQKYIIVGGTGLYIRSLIYNFQIPEFANNVGLREHYKALAQEKGCEYLHEQLSKVDAASASRIKPNDEFRLIRALEVYETIGKKLSEVRSMDTTYAEKFQLICLNNERKIVYEDIERRVDIMLSKGLMDEVKGLLDAGYAATLPSMQALGYKEIVAYLTGSSSLPDAVDLIKKRTRHFAKRQLTWYRSFPNVEWITMERKG